MHRLTARPNEKTTWETACCEKSLNKLLESDAVVVRPRLWLISYRVIRMSSAFEFP